MSRWIGYCLTVFLCSVWILAPGCGGHQCLSGSDCKVGEDCLSIRTGSGLTRLCVPVTQLPVGSMCKKDEDCSSNVCYSKSGLRFCSKPCGATEPCSGGLVCASAGADLKLCQFPDSTGSKEGCRCGKQSTPCTKNGHTDCDIDNGFFCLSSGPNDPKARCVQQCNPKAKPKEKGACAEGFVCSKSAAGLYLCVTPQFTPGKLGKNCGKGGKAECDSKLFCFSRWSTDNDAFCSKHCSPYKEKDCGEGFVCETPTERSPWMCIPKGGKKVGEDCSQRSFLECQSALCVRDNGGRGQPFCSQPCKPDKDECPVGFRCRLFGHLYRYLCSKASGGEIGTLCNKNGTTACKSGICISPGPGAINKICSQACDGDIKCPGGFECDLTKKYCIPKTGKKKIGEPCTSPQECVFGTCASDSQGKSFCTQRCTEDSQCPSKFECRNLEFTQRYCLPKRAGNRKLGEPCPNGPGDCATGNCLSDPINNRTFCTQSCAAKPVCPKPYKCTRLNKREAYCTPQDYQLP